MAVSIIRRHNSIGSLLDVAAKTPRDRTCVSDRKGGDVDWTGTASLDESLRFARYGGWDPDVATEFRDIFEAKLPKLRTYVSDELVEGRDVSGFEVDVAGYCIGEPEHMHEWLPAENVINKRAFCVLIGHSISSGVTAEEIFIRGQAVVALVRALATMGYELEVWSEITLGGYGTSADYTTLTCLHHAGEVMDQSAIEFSIGNPSWLRRIIFAAEETEPMDVRKAYGFMDGSGYGSPKAPIHKDTVNADMVLDLGRAWFGEDWDNDDHEKLAESGYSWVVKQLTAAGVIDQDA